MIFNLIGLPCSGKSAIALELSRTFGWPIISIGQFRNKKKNQRKSINASEFYAWRDMASAIKMAGNCVIESAGLNHRLKPILNNIGSLMTIKLTCSKKELLRRCRNKNRTGFFPYSINDREFIGLYWKKMKHLPSDITIKTDKCSIKKTMNDIMEFDEKK